MEEITITQNGYNGLYMSYLYGKVQQRFSFLPAVCNLKEEGEYAELSFRAERAYCPYVKRFAEENIADVLAVGYKYAFFEKRLVLPFLKAEERRLLFTALVSADYKDDKAYAYRRLGGSNRYCLDGVYHFRLRELKKRWEGIAEYVPTDMNTASLEGFLEFLTEDGEGKLFLKDGKVYDEEYRLLSRSVLTGEESAIGEILLGQAERVYCFGDTDKNTTRFLKRYYGSKAVFC
ncbi:MAG: hypothetical protein E7381_04460 [Clostridiales bacterium]|nr:hypothetical protein [Clostridiales bacterium]